MPKPNLAWHQQTCAAHSLSWTSSLSFRYSYLMRFSSLASGSHFKLRFIFQLTFSNSGYFESIINFPILLLHFLVSIYFQGWLWIPCYTIINTRSDKSLPYTICTNSKTNIHLNVSFNENVLIINQSEWFFAFLSSCKICEVLQEYVKKYKDINNAQYTKNDAIMVSKCVVYSVNN